MIEKEQILNPKIKVDGIDNTCNMSLTEIEQDINEINFKNYDTKCQVVHMSSSTYDSRNKLKCANCAYSNLKHNTKYNCNHEATDSDNCNIFKNKIRKYIESVDYLIKPKIDKYINKVGKEEHNNTPKITDGNTQQQHLKVFLIYLQIYQ